MRSVRRTSARPGGSAGLLENSDSGFVFAVESQVAHKGGGRQEGMRSGWTASLVSTAVLLAAGASVAFVPPARTLCGPASFRWPPSYASARGRSGLGLLPALGAAQRGARLRMQAEGDEAGLSDAEISGLLARVSAAKGRVQTMPICVLDCMLPRQRLEFATSDDSFKALLQHCKDAAGGQDLGRFGMLGVDRANRCMMRQGTEVEVVRADDRGDGTVAVELVGMRCLQLIGDPWLQDLGSEEAAASPAPLAEVAAGTQDSSKYIMARVEFTPQEDGEGPRSDAAEEMGVETERMIDSLVSDADREANVQLAKELEALVDTWCDLVVQKGLERRPMQIASILRNLGTMPPADRPFDRALWVAALINPLPALGVALEIRPAVLQAPSAAAALAVVTSGIQGSIGHVNGSKPLF